MVAVGYAVEAMQRGDVSASETVMNFLRDSDRKALADLIEKEIDQFSIGALELLSRYLLVLPVRSKSWLAVCHALIVHAQSTMFSHTQIAELAQRVPTGVKRALRSRTNRKRARLSDEQWAIFSLLVGDEESATKEFETRKISRAGTVETVVQRAQRILKLAPTASPDDLVRLSRETAQMPDTAWSREARNTLFVHALRAGVLNRVDLSGVNRETVLNELVNSRLEKNQFSVFGHPAWCRMRGERQLQLLRVAIARVSQLGDRSLRATFIDNAVTAIRGLKSPLRIIVAEQFLEAFGEDELLDIEQLWQMRSFSDCTTAQGSKFLRSLAVALLMRNENALANECLVAADARERADWSGVIQRLLGEIVNADDLRNSDIRGRSIALLVGKLADDQPQVLREVSGMLASRSEETLMPVVSNLIVQGHAVHAMRLVDKMKAAA